MVLYSFSVLSMKTTFYLDQYQNIVGSHASSTIKLVGKQIYPTCAIQVHIELCLSGIVTPFLQLANDLQKEKT